MSQDLIVIHNDPYVEEFYKWIEERTEKEKEIMKIGYGIGRYTDFELSFDYDDRGNVMVTCSQSLKLQSLFSDVLRAWG